MDSDSGGQEFGKIIFGKSVADLSASASSSSFVLPEYLIHPQLYPTQPCLRLEDEF